MQTIHTTFGPQYFPTQQKQSAVKRFMNWCTAQEKNRLGWLAAMVTLHGCVLAPITIAFLFLGGNQMIFWSMTIAAMAMTLITNLAALPTKVTIPVFFLSLLIDFAVIVINIVIYAQTLS